MTFDFLSREGRAAVVAAQRLARARDEEAVELEHLLHALTEAPASAQVLERAGADLARLRARLDQALRALPKVPGAKVYLGERVLRLLDLAQVEARERGEAGGLARCTCCSASRSRPARRRPRCCASWG